MLSACCVYRFPDFISWRRNELSELLDDLSAVGILHRDVKFNNFLHPAPEPYLASEMCPRHKRVHPWRVIDFDRAFRWNPANPSDWKGLSHYQATDVQEPTFWGALS